MCITSLRLKEMRSLALLWQRLKNPQNLKKSKSVKENSQFESKKIPCPSKIQKGLFTCSV
jgi:hypothetical protein